MDGTEHPFLDGRDWPATSSHSIHFDKTLSAQSVQNGMDADYGWDSFLQWTPGHGQPSGELATTSNAPSLYDRTVGSIDEQPTHKLGAVGAAMSTPGSSNTPLAFGQAMSVAPGFDFTSPPSMISPLDKQNFTFNGHNTASSQSLNDPSRPLVTSAFSHGGQVATTMPMHAPPSNGSLQQSPSSNNARAGSSDSPPSSSEPDHRTRNMKKRKPDDDDEPSGEKGGPPKKTAHNMIEKRYRTNLNDKIAALRDSVPSLRVMSRANAADDDEEEVDLEGLAPAHKLNKATVLSKATEYIRHLEKRNKKLQDELSALKKQLESYEKMSMTSFAYSGNVATPEGASYEQNPFEQVSSRVSGPNPVRGMIPIPQELRQMRESTVHGQPYVTSSASYPVFSSAGQQQQAPGRPVVNGRGSNFVNKMMVGSLAGLMLFEGFVEREKSGEEPEGRGLFALPVSLLSSIGSHVWPQAFPLGASASDAIALLKACLIFGAVVYVLLPLLAFETRPKKKPEAVSLNQVPAIASPIDVRRKAWLTAIQTVWVPQHQFVLEAAALLLKTLKLSTRKLIGWQGYALIWNVTKEQEAARVKAWDIALDAQLTGGDAEISMSRLVLTLLASGTLPDTPARLMLKALHIRVLLWEVAKAGYGTWFMFDELSLKLARRYWNQARLENKMIKNNMKQRQEDDQNDRQELPAHLEALLSLECDTVLVKPVVQRAYNLAWNRPSSENTQSDVSTDSVVNDFAISSPLDALAAWFSSLLTNFALEQSLLKQTRSVLESVDAATAIAPPMSAVHVRALAAKAVLAKKDRLHLVDAAYKALPKPASVATLSDSKSSLNSQPPLLIVPNTPASSDVPEALGLAKCLGLVEAKVGDSKEIAGLSDRAVSALLMYRPTETSFSILSFAAAYQVLDHFSADPELRLKTRPALERMANAMRVWIGKESGKPAVAALSLKTRTIVVDRCIQASKMLSGVCTNDDNSEEESDAGYGSLEEGKEKS
ncbi:hypothetical protein, variant [Verruconis gallopava]|nr:hypothetical protein, variant [Verruconis gallopava]KIW03560.1 hypothetical protein, variant [Verruconis gallopava]